MKPNTPFFLGEICSPDRGINLDTLKNTIILAIKTAREGQEGRKVGTIFTVSDSEKVLKQSKCMILDPLNGYSEAEKRISVSLPNCFYRHISLFDRRTGPGSFPLFG